MKPSGRFCLYILAAWFGALLLFNCPSSGQLIDNTQSTNTINAGINKSFTQEVGAGHGDVMTPDSSMFIIRRRGFNENRRDQFRIFA